MKTAGTLANRLVVMYAFALSCIAVAAIGAYLVLQWGLVQGADNAARINQSGHQRMVVQRLMALSSRLVTLDEDSAIDEVSQEMRMYLQDLEVTHEALAHDFDPRGRVVSLPPGHDVDGGGWSTSLPDESLTLYHGVGGLDDLVPAYGSLIRDLMATPAEQRNASSVTLAGIYELGDGRLAELLEQAVREEELEAARDISRLYALERMILGITLSLLFLECIFIFLPTARAVRTAMQKEKEFSSELQVQIHSKNAILANLSQTQRELRKLSIVPKYSGDGTILIDNRGRIEWVNSTFSTLSGWSLEEVRGRRPSDALSNNESLRRFEDEIGQSLEEGSWRREIEVTSRTGQVYWVDVGVNTVREKGSSQNQLVAVFRDITEMVQHRKMLERSNAQADAANLAKTQFLANMSHEIRTPMNGIIGMNYLLLTTDLDEEQKEYAETVQASSEHLLTVINNILDLSKLEAGEVEIAHHPFVLGELIESSLGAVRGIAVQKDIELRLENEIDQNASFNGDIDHLRQILINILGNAVKFTDEGEVALIIRQEEDRVMFEISDTGTGMSADQLPHLFDRFYQVDGSATRAQEGSGLGLAICNELVDRMVGRIEVDSDLNQGTTFRIYIPLERVQESSSVDSTLRQAKSA